MDFTTESSRALWFLEGTTRLLARKQGGKKLRRNWIKKLREVKVNGPECFRYLTETCKGISKLNL